ncbi:MAG: tetratricopeptide repeat protein [Sulfurospirillaceae bacterium]|nr:tetratricopeptide repeat protein [Sulfurospirillaceae bacterium]
METFFIEYRDPMFGIIILFSLIFIISFVNYWWGVFKTKEERQSITQFIKRFEVATDDDGYKKILDEFKLSTESLGLLAHSYNKSGDFEKSISIYLLALKQVKNKDEKQYILTALGKTYFKAGFLRRSEEVFLEALKLFPRNEVALKYLTVSYEKLKEYDRSLEVLDALEELGASVATQKLYLEAMKILEDNKIPTSSKIEELKHLKTLYLPAKRMLFEFLINSGEKIDWDEVALFDPSEIIDLFWYLDSSKIDPKPFKHPTFLTILKVKNLIKDAPKKSSFELEILSILHDAKYNKAGLSFEYLCQSCKQTFPMHFYRCPACHELSSVKIIPTITKEQFETRLPF